MSTAPTVEIDGTFNARDVGGHVTASGASMRTGVLFRSASLDRIGDAGRADLMRLGIRTVVDLRSVHETDSSGTFDPAGTGITLHLLDSVIGPPTEDPDRLQQVLESDDPMAGIYTKMVTDGAAMFVDALRLLARGHDPMIVHCTSGKDRTGLLAMFVQLLCDVPIDAVLDDYERSAAWSAAVEADLGERFPDMRVVGPEKLARMAATDRRWIHGALDAIGGVDHVPAWLAANGVDPSAQRTIRERFLT